VRRNRSEKRKKRGKREREHTRGEVFGCRIKRARGVERFGAEIIQIQPLAEGGGNWHGTCEPISFCEADPGKAYSTIYSAIGFSLLFALGCHQQVLDCFIKKEREISAPSA
jgi:hypothetical protein